jgi:TetR/AcrR family transcriptional repressor of nem operon
VGVAELMATAGFTHGGFYRHFQSKADLMAEAAACSFSQTTAKFKGVDMVEFIKNYVSRWHRDARSDGCALAALGGDAARQSDTVKETFTAGIEDLLDGLERDDTLLSDEDRKKSRAKAIDMLAHAVGAIVLSRACPDDSPLADEILSVCRAEMLGPLTSTASIS